MISNFDEAETSKPTLKNKTPSQDTKKPGNTSIRLTH